MPVQVYVSLCGLLQSVAFPLRAKQTRLHGKVLCAAGTHGPFVCSRRSGCQMGTGCGCLPHSCYEEPTARHRAERPRKHCLHTCKRCPRAGSAWFGMKATAFWWTICRISHRKTNSGSRTNCAGHGLQRCQSVKAHWLRPGRTLVRIGHGGSRGPGAYRPCSAGVLALYGA